MLNLFKLNLEFKDIRKRGDYIILSTPSDGSIDFFQLYDCEEKTKLSTEEMNSIKVLKEGFANVTSYLGNIEMQILNLELEKDKVKDELKSLKAQEISLADELKNKYGDGNISLETGEFTPFEKEEAPTVG